MKSAPIGVLGIAAITLTLAGTLSSTARADSIAFTSPGGLTTDVGANAPVNLGLVFTANSTFSVDALGIFDGTFLASSEQVGLYDSSGHLLTSATVALSDPLASGYLFHSITPVTLTAGNTYTIDAYVGNNAWDYGSTAPNQAAAVTYDYHDYFYTGSLAYPTSTAGAAGGPSGTYYGPNFEIGTSSAVPEPDSLGPLMIAVALAGCFLYFRKGSPIKRTLEPSHRR